MIPERQSTARSESVTMTDLLSEYPSRTCRTVLFFSAGFCSSPLGQLRFGPRKAEVIKRKAADG
jgi:hypothetical protein